MDEYRAHVRRLSDEEISRRLNTAMGNFFNMDEEHSSTIYTILCNEENYRNGQDIE